MGYLRTYKPAQVKYLSDRYPIYTVLWGSPQNPVASNATLIAAAKASSVHCLNDPLYQYYRGWYAYFSWRRYRLCHLAQEPSI